MLQQAQDELGNRIHYKGFDVRFHREVIFHLIDCYPESPIYDTVVEEYEELIEEVYPLIDPEAILKFGPLLPSVQATDYQVGTPACYVLISIGDKVSKLSTKYFNEGNYLAGMLVNTIADDCLLSLERQVNTIIKEQCVIRKMGVHKRLEAPLDIPMEAQEIVLFQTEADKLLDLGVTEGYMFTKVKSTCSILILTEDQNVFQMQHDCSKCNSVNCKMKKLSGIPLEVVRGDKTFHILCKEEESIMDALLRNDIYVSAICGGRGTCGKCKIQVLEGTLEATSQDGKYFTTKELEDGYRLSCKAYPKEECKFRIVSGDEADFEVVTDGRNLNNHGQEQDFTYGIGVDIGTTTLAISLVGLESGKAYDTYTTVNKQRRFGADVLSRIQASNTGKWQELQESIRNDLSYGIRQLLKKTGINNAQLKTMAISGNTTMGHLLMGYSCETLGVYPFTPYNIERVRSNYKEVIGSEELDIPVELLPGISTFVGADILSGLITCNFDQEDRICMLIDLGTNGEMALGNKSRILVTSTAAGPAFEGGNITYGVGSIAGAIHSVTFEQGVVRYKTIADKAPVGICGTGVVEITAELLKAGMIDETGRFMDEYMDQGFVITEDSEPSIVFTPKDIREIQLAKSAVRAGIETLMLRYGISYEQIDTVYLAGGFGYKINIEKAIRIGLLPKEFSGNIKSIGNSSLTGAITYLTEPNTVERMEKLRSITDEISLASDKDFNELYMSHMFFDEEEFMNSGI